ncbi:hypothetical protein [Pedobacter sp. Leaf176]|uniref:hypothetical protein n=1 Tax=Pedobacter sp. Leaf176 TaxID=1736286 RepID=UPI0006F638D9|nr:hypothetical protein [Pedobacter sp. Leaf176]KQR67709.1 hypothetical protein ASF92_18735 [Pedobacter sp. Leaf176]
MSPRSLFSIILKVIGIFLVKDIFTVLFKVYSGLAISFNSGFSDLSTAYISYLVIIFINFLVPYLLLFKTQAIIGIFNLDSGFEEEEFSMTLHRSSILSIGIIVTGGFLFVSEIPNLCNHVFNYIQLERMMSAGQINQNQGFIILSIGKILIGLFLIYFQRAIVNFIELKRKA